MKTIYLFILTVITFNVFAQSTAGFLPVVKTYKITEPFRVKVISKTNVQQTGGNNGLVSVIAIGGSGVYSYVWNTTPVQTTATATGLSVGYYTVTVTDEIMPYAPSTVEVYISEPPYYPSHIAKIEPFSIPPRTIICKTNVKNANEKLVSENNVGFTTPNKDTLYLTDDDVGMCIKEIWGEDTRYTGKKPVIFLVPNIAKIIANYKNFYFTSEN